MSNYRYSSDLIEQMLFNAGEPTDGTSDYDSKAVVYLNRAYHALAGGGAEIDPNCTEIWHWLLTSSTLTLEPFYSTGTVSVTQNSASATLSAVKSATAAGWHFRTDEDGTVYKISAHTAGTAALTLDSVYVGDTNGTATYKLFKLEYDLASNVRDLATSMRVAAWPYEIESMPYGAMLARYPLSSVGTDTPSYFAQVDDNTVIFNSFVNDYLRVDYSYIRYPDDLTDSASEEPAVPKQWRKILSDFGAYLILVDKNDNRADTYILMARGALTGMRQENRRKQYATGRFGAILPRANRRQRGVLRTESGHILG